MQENEAIETLQSALAEAFAAGGFVKLSLTKPTASAGDVKSIDIRPILVKRALKLSFTTHHTTRDVVKNYTLEEALALIESHLLEHFRAAYLTTLAGDVQLNHAATGYQLKRHAASVSSAPDLTHDRAKQRAIDPIGKAYLHALAITDAKGVVYKNAQDKFRQINKYIEILDGLLSELPKTKLRILDMGAGKGYLTFALYDYLANACKREVEITGVEFRAELVAQCNAIAQAAEFTGLTFVEGSIADYDCTGADVVIALHACDTATDDAIAKAISAGAALIVVAPCCHKQIRKSMAALPPTHALAPMLRHGTYVERMAEMITDTLRAEFMAMQGYRTKLFEFISDAHTSKNVMIVATKSNTHRAADAAKHHARIEALKTEFGIKHHALEALLGA